MNEVRYIISDAANKVSVEPHVLRYWEEELDLKIPRNEMGHRYYREKDIEMLLAQQLQSSFRRSGGHELYSRAAEDIRKSPVIKYVVI